MRPIHLYESRVFATLFSRRSSATAFGAVNYRLLSFVVGSFFLMVSVVFASDVFGQNFTTLHRGVEYAHVSHRIGDAPVNINLLRLDLTKVRLDVVRAFDRAIGTETTSSIANRHKALAAINAGFFRLDKSTFAGDSAGLLMIDGELLSESERSRIAMRILNGKKRTEVMFSHRDVVAWFNFGANSQIKLSGVNRERKEGEIIAYDSFFGQMAPPSPSGTDLVLKNCRRQKSKKMVWQACSELEIVEPATQTSIPPGGYVISLGADDRLSKRALLRELRVYLSSDQKRREFGVRASDSSRSYPEESEDATNGVPQLIKQGRIDITWEQEKASRAFAETRHPRTAVATLKDSMFLMVTVDGRQPGVSVGMSLQELAEYLLSLGAIDAMNLDGGGSTTMFVDGRVVNKPSDKEGERKISDAIIVTSRKNSRR
jgi:hypothetical protein